MTNGPPEVSAAIAKIKEYIYPRRMRVKELFVHYDRLRCGAVSQSRFVRGVHSIGSDIDSTEIRGISNHFRRPDGEDIDYLKFCEEVDGVYGPAHLEKDPVFESAGASTPSFQREKVEGQERVEEILHQLCLLARTRGVVIKYYFQDFDRSEAASLTVRRHSGKVTRDVFKRQFPFRSHFSEEDIKLVMKRYTDQRGMVHYQALHDDVVALSTVEEQEDAAPCVVAQEALHWTQEDVSPVDRVRARIIERRLILRDYFHDFDALRKGTCAPGQARSVFSIMDLVVSEADFAALCDEFCHDHRFHYEAFLDRIGETFSVKDLEMHPLVRLPSPSPDCTLSARKNCVKLSAAQVTGLENIESNVRERIRQKRLPIRDIFRDFDRTHQSHVTESQFSRVLTNLGLQPDDIALLTMRYADRGTMRDVNYLEFCSAVEPPTDAMLQCSTPYKTVATSKYFDQEGDIIPAV